jgi:D-alanyl-D-alanine carboxypeptidase (penicillin-binding protein 5/6)
MLVSFILMGMFMLTNIVQASTDTTVSAPAISSSALSSSSTTTAPTMNTATSTPMLIPAPPKIAAQAYVLLDANSGKIIVEKNMEQRRPPASLTKMMTLYLISQALQNGTIKLDDQVLISKDAWKMGGSKMFVKVGNRVAVKDLLQGIIVDSGNDACVAMAEFISGSQDVFASMMNTQAKILGMNNTHFVDCTGLPNEEHYTTAYDMAILARALVNNFPQYYPWYKQKWFTYNDIRQPNRNRLLWRYPYADGIKTGHTQEAGFCLASSALKDGMRLIAIVMGAPTDEARANASVRLLTYGFRFFKTYAIYQPDVVVTKLKVWFGAAKYLRVGVKDGLYVTAAVGQLRNAKVTMQIPSDIKAPVQKGQVIGKVLVTAGDKTIATAPLVALADVGKGGFWRRSVDHTAHAFHGWFGSEQTKTKNISLVDQAT